MKNEQPENLPKTKRCSKCGIEKALTEFFKQKSCAFGRRPECRLCHNQQRAQWKGYRCTGRTNRRDGQSPAMKWIQMVREVGRVREQKQRCVELGVMSCRTCGENKPIAEYRCSKITGLPNGTCKACERSWMKVYRQKRKENARVQP